MKTKIAAVLAVVVFVGMAFGASAFTTATIDRTSTITVASDSNGIVGLNDGSSDMVTQSNEELTIDTTGNNYDGLNVNSTFVIGDTNDANNTFAFNVTNNDGASHSMEFGYAMASDPDTNSDQVTFDVYDSTGASQGSFTESTNGTFTLASTETYYVVMTIDTTGLSSTADLSGTVTISVS